ncbi:unnamed protein product [Penicillium salamii]|uniref:HMG box domain-containing protein n=1 Tax=Penicillium salamii TaxID=1612424 RepID=A0A9W4NC35_9EURO|nr:unnamed protein product [Penicillium salamii]
MSQDSHWQLEDPDTMYPRRALEVYWLDACKHLESSNGEILVDFDTVHQLMGMNNLKEMATRLAAIRNKRIHIIPEADDQVYRLTPNGPPAGVPSSMSTSDNTMDSSEASQITVVSVSTSASSSAKVPRPPNCFILYRQAHHEEVKATHPGITNNEISRILGARWKNECDEIRSQYIELAEQIKLQHAIQHPDYQYAPRRPSERRRRATRIRGPNSAVEEDLADGDISNMHVDPQESMGLQGFDMTVFDTPFFPENAQSGQLQAAGFGDNTYAPDDTDPDYMTLDDIDEMLAAYSN